MSFSLKIQIFAPVAQEKALDLQVGRGTLLIIKIANECSSPDIYKGTLNGLEKIWSIPYVHETNINKPIVALW